MGNFSVTRSPLDVQTLRERLGTLKALGIGCGVYAVFAAFVVTVLLHESARIPMNFVTFMLVLGLGGSAIAALAGVIVVAAVSILLKALADSADAAVQLVRAADVTAE